MKYCPQCSQRFSDAWITFCTDDGSLLRDELIPPADPNWDPRIRPTEYDDPAERATQWMPHDTQRSGGWMPPDERGPIESAPVERPWQPPPPPTQPYVKPGPGSGPPGIAVASMVVGIVGVMFGLLCAAPVPGIVAVILGVIALRQMTNAPNPAGRSMAIAGIVLGSINLVFFAFGMLWFLMSLLFG
jgi:hypothetical protein